MRVITEHIVNPANDKLAITVVDGPGIGGAQHHYIIEGADLSRNPSVMGNVNFEGDQTAAVILFQNGPISADGNGVNGITHEALLAILADRLRSFQEGPYRCKENACALTHIEEAMMWLQRRTLARMRRGVEGTHQV